MIDKLGSLNLEQVRWWDETHKKVETGSVKEFQTLFCWDKKDGNLDPYGKVAAARPLMKVKFSDEIRLLFGVEVQYVPPTKRWQVHWDAFVRV